MRAVDPNDYWVSTQGMKVSATHSADDIHYEHFGIAEEGDLPAQVEMNGRFWPNIKVYIDNKPATGTIRVKYAMFPTDARVDFTNKFRR